MSRRFEIAIGIGVIAGAATGMLAYLQACSMACLPVISIASLALAFDTEEKRLGFARVSAISGGLISAVIAYTITACIARSKHKRSGSKI
jgi:hypothetical protein